MIIASKKKTELMAKNIDGVIALLQQWFDQAPALPKNAKDILVKLAPILAPIFGTIGIVVGVLGFAALTFFVPAVIIGGVHGRGYYGYGAGFITAASLIIASVCLLLAGKGLRQRHISGWMMLFWSELIMYIGMILAHLTIASVIGMLIGAIVGLYILFQIKPYYK